MATKNTSDYVISEVNPIRGNLRFIHIEVLKRECYIVDVEVGHRGMIMYANQYDNMFHRLHTSVIESVNEEDDGNRVIIRTKNTEYVLSRINFNDDFLGIQKYTLKDAKKEVCDYLRRNKIPEDSVCLIKMVKDLYNYKKDCVVVQDSDACNLLFARAIDSYK